MATIGDKIAAGILRARKVLIPGADHLPNMRRPDAFNELLLGFLRESLPVAAAPR